MNPLVIGVVLLVAVMDAAVLAGFAYYFGLFTRVRVETVELPPLWLAYERRTGPYMGVAAVMEPMREVLARRYGIASTQMFGIYLDDPRKRERNAVRGVLGCVISETDAARLPELTEGFYLAPTTRQPRAHDALSLQGEPVPGDWGDAGRRRAPAAHGAEWHTGWPDNGDIRHPRVGNPVLALFRDARRAS